ncbi:MAG: hypothetical protein JWP44_5105 [Mucilaginibacter sp.]|nr:hypothetical protein [Mucilaginibacter sp.]
MAEPVSTSAAAFFSMTKVWSIFASVCGSIIPVMALSDKHKVSVRGSLFMAATGSSFAIFVGPWAAVYFNINSIEAIAGLSWTMGVVGVYLIRAVLKWLDTKGVSAVDRLFSKVTGTEPAEVVVIKERISVVEGQPNRDEAGD